MKRPKRVGKPRGDSGEEIKISRVRRLFRLICPCNPRADQSNYPNHPNKGASPPRHQPVVVNQTLETSACKTQIIFGFEQSLLFKTKQSSPESLKKRHSTMDASLDLSCGRQPMQHKIILIGSGTNMMIAKSTDVLLSPSAESLEKILACQPRPYHTKTSNPNVEAFWKDRYFIFEKFDLGIQIDPDSYTDLIPEAVTEHIASRIKCDTVLDGFCGIGSMSIKLGNRCLNVMANDPRPKRLDCLENNASIYGIDNISKTNKHFLDLTGIRVNIVYLRPPPNRKVEPENTSIDPDVYFSQPSLQQLVEKSLSFSNNIILLLPFNTNIDKVGQIYHKALASVRPYDSISCSVEIQKIHFFGKGMYLAVYYGPMVNSQVKFKDQLQAIYLILNGSKNSTFNHKELVKHVRQLYGMIGLLSLVTQCLYGDQSKVLQRFLQLIKSNNLLTQKLYMQLTKPGLKYNWDNQQDSDNQLEDSQVTQSNCTLGNRSVVSYQAKEFTKIIIIQDKDKARNTFGYNVETRAHILERTGLL